MFDPEKAGKELIDGLQEVTMILEDDIRVLMDGLKTKENIGFWRRASIRSLFADMEATAFQFRQRILFDNECSANKLSLKDTVMLKELAFRINDRGEAEESGAKVRFANNFLFTMKLAWIGIKKECPIDTSKDDWSNFKAAIALRDRITHPRRAVDLEITDPEMDIILRVGDWFKKIMVRYAEAQA